jgi:hypothetical protein
MNYKTMVIDIIMYTMKRIELADYDLNITREEIYEGEIVALTGLLEHIEIMLGNKSDPKQLTECKAIIREAMGELYGEKGNEYLDRWLIT